MGIHSLNRCNQRKLNSEIAGIAFDVLDMLIGAHKGVTRYKILNMNTKMSSSEKRMLEKVFDVITNSELAEKDELIEKIYSVFA